MNRGVLQSSPVQQMMVGNPSWWNSNSMRPPASPQTSPFLPPPNLFPDPSSSSSSWDDNQELPESWSQLLSGRLVEEDERGHLHGKKMESWEEQVLHHSSTSSAVNVKQESHQNSFIYGHANEDFQAAPLKPTWSQMMPVSSPKSCVTSFSSNMLDFSTNKADGKHPPPDPSSECNSTATGGAVKKARIQPAAATQSKLKVRKEKLGDRVTALHQLVSPFGKTDTASVLLEAIGYIRFLQSQIETLSLPYLGARQQQQSVQGERNCIFPEDPGQLLNDNCIKRKGVSEQESVEEGKKDLRSRGLCLVPLSCTLQVGSDSGADYWALSSLGGGFR